MPTPVTDACVLAALAEAPATTVDLVRHRHWSYVRLSGTLGGLMRRGLVERSNAGVYALTAAGRREATKESEPKHGG